jgi:ABC-2 type transport system permease protein
MFERIQSIIIKEFRQISRDFRMKLVLFVMPMFQVIVFGFAVSTDVRKIETAVYDLDNTPQSRQLIREFSYCKYFVIKKYITSEQQLKDLIDKSIIKTVIRINHGFAQNLLGRKNAQFQLIIDGTDSNIAGVILQYANQIISGYSSKLSGIRLEAVLQKAGGIPFIDLRSRVWFNDNLESKNFYVPGIVALIVLILTMLLTAMAIVKEKEIGTIEQLIVSPLKPIELILGKLLPFAMIGLADIFLITTAAVLVFKVPMRGNLILLFASSCLYILTTLGLGLLISTNAKTLQESIMSTFFIAMPAVLLSGFVFPIVNMPKIIQYITYFNPLRYYIVIVRGIFLKGSTFEILWPQMLTLLIMGIFILTLSTLRFHKRLG